MAVVKERMRFLVLRYETRVQKWRLYWVLRENLVKLGYGNLAKLLFWVNLRCEKEADTP